MTLAAQRVAPGPIAAAAPVVVVLLHEGGRPALRFFVGPIDALGAG